jgi:hypothetical protein
MSIRNQLQLIQRKMAAGALSETQNAQAMSLVLGLASDHKDELADMTNDLLACEEKFLSARGAILDRYAALLRDTEESQ